MSTDQLLCACEGREEVGMRENMVQQSIIVAAAAPAQSANFFALLIHVRVNHSFQ